MNQDDLIETLTGDLEKMFGPSPHKEHFAALLSNILSDIEKANVVGNGGVCQLLVEVLGNGRANQTTSGLSS